MFKIGSIPWNKGLVTPVKDRFWSKVKKMGPNDCWPWIGHCDKQGYGQFNGKHASRIAWELIHGPINDQNIDVCHTCDNTSCVNPNHLFLGSAMVNIQDCVSKGRFDHSGEKNGRAKLTKDLAREIRNTKLPQRVLAVKFCVSKANIYYIQKRLTWN